MLSFKIKILAFYNRFRKEIILWSFIAFIVFGLITILFTKDASLRYEEKQILNYYPSIWVGLSIPKNNIQDGKDWVVETSDLINSDLGNKYIAKYKFNPEIEDKYLLLYSSLGKLEELKNNLADTIKGKNLNILDGLFSTEFTSKDQDLGSAEVSSGLDLPQVEINDHYKYSNSYYKKDVLNGEKVSVKLEILNDGEQEWKKDKVVLITSRYSDKSNFYDSKWISKGEIATIQEDLVKPTEIATFEFDLDTNLVGENQREYFRLAKKNDDEVITLIGDELYIAINIHAEENEVKDKIDVVLGEMEEYISYFDTKTAISNITRRLDFSEYSDDLKNVLSFDDEGFLIPKTKNFVAFKITPLQGLITREELSIFVSDVETKIAVNKIPRGGAVMTVGYPIHLNETVTLYDNYASYIWMLLLISTFIISFAVNRNKLMVVILSFTQLSATAITIFLLNTIFGNLSVTFYILFNIFIFAQIIYSLFFLTKIEKLENHDIDSKFISFTKIYHLIFLSSIGILIPILFINIIDTYQVLVAGIFIYIWTFCLNIYSYNIFVYIIQFKCFRNLNLLSVINLKFLDELTYIFAKGKYFLIVIFSLLYLIGFVYVRPFNISDDFKISDRVLKNEMIINLIYKANFIYPMELEISSVESLKNLHSYFSASKIFANSESILNYVPDNQQRKLGIISNLKKTILGDGDFVNRREITSNDLADIEESMGKYDFWFSKISELSQNDVYKIDDKLLSKYQTFRNQIKELNSDKDALDILNKLDEERFIEFSKFYENFKKALSIESPMTIFNFNSEVIRDYKTNDGYIIRLFTLSSIFNKDTRSKASKEIADRGYESKSLLAFDYLSNNIIFISILFIFLIVFLILLFLLKSHSKFILSYILIISYLFFSHLVFSLTIHQYSLTDIIYIFQNTIIILFILVYLFSEDFKESNIIKPAFILTLSGSLFTWLITARNVTDYFYTLMTLLPLAFFFTAILLTITIKNNPLLSDSLLSRVGLNKLFAQGLFSNDNLEKKKGNDFIAKIIFKFKNFKHVVYEKMRKKTISKINEEKIITKSEEKKKDVPKVRPTEPESKIEDVIDKNISHKRSEETRFISEELTKEVNEYDFGHAKYIPIHVFETEREITIEAEVGTIKIYDVDISIDQGVLKIKSIDSYEGSPFERHISVNMPIFEDKIHVDIDDQELIINIPKRIPENENLQSNIIKRNDSDGSKDKILSELMGDSESEYKKNKSRLVNYEVSNLENNIFKILVTLKDVTSKNIILNLEDNIFTLSPRDQYRDKEIRTEIVLEKPVIMQSVNTKIGDNTIMITGKYRPNFFELKNIISED